MKKLFEIHLLYLAILMLFIFYACNDARENTLENSNSADIINSPSRSTTYIDLKKLLKNKKDKDATVIYVKYDHYFKAPKKYKGFLLNSILDSVVKVSKVDTTSTLVVFECSDGYKPIMDFSKLYTNAKGYIVYKDLDQSGEKKWADSVYKKFEPYYLVWDDVKKEDESFMWPYGLTGIRLVPMEIEYQSIYPANNDTLLIAGFSLFRNNCMKCHSVNKIGGTMGPEFNIPKNITEYWKSDDIVSFAKQPGSYRYNSRMPPIENLTDSEFDKIVLYLKYIKDHRQID